MSSHLILLPLQSLHVVELLRLQLGHPFMQLVDLVPAQAQGKNEMKIKSFVSENMKMTKRE